MLVQLPHTHTHIYTQPFNSPLSRTTQISHYQKKHLPRIGTDNKVCFEPVRVVRPNWASIKTRLEGQLKLTAVPLTDYGSLCQQSWLQYLLLCRAHCILYLLPPLLLAIFWILWCRAPEADAPTIHLDAAPSGLLVPPPPSSPNFYAKCPFCHNSPN